MSSFDYHRQKANEFPNLSGRLVDNGRYELLDVLGAGSYGKVYKALDISANDFVAVKCLEKPEADSDQEKCQILEFSLHKKVSAHPNVITFHHHFFEDEFVFVVLDLCDGGDLFTALTSSDFFYNRDDRVTSIMVQLIDALEYCHNEGVYHRDIKPENILLDKTGHVYLADFGFSTDNAFSMDFQLGTRGYISPECFGEDTDYLGFKTAGSDIWALGIILATIITGQRPWSLASTADECFAAFLSHPNYLMEVFSMSTGADQILQGVLSPDHLGRRTSLPDLRQQILNIDTFFAVDPCPGTSLFWGFSTSGDIYASESDEEFPLRPTSPQGAIGIRCQIQEVVVVSSRSHECPSTHCTGPRSAKRPRRFRRLLKRTVRYFKIVSWNRTMNH
ncbi:kinase-like domain-containing protein [Mycena floridula]|nr:kinase-like domain-containing protein [Mycena floridula]